MERRGFQAEIGKVTYNNGLKIEARRVEEQFHASDTSEHEAIHAVVAIENGTGVKKVTRISGPGYLGLTQLDSFDPIAAVAPHADGHDGTSYDVSLLEMNGESISSASERAKNIISRTERHINNVAKALDEKGTLSGGDVVSIMKEVDEGEEVIIDISSSGGEKKTVQTRTNEPFVMIPDKVLILAA